MVKGVVLLFVCSGNTCRSVMAEGLFTKAWGKWGHKEIPLAVYSAGMETIDGLAATGEALMVLSDEGVDLSDHRSQTVNDALIEKADYVFTMTSRQKEALLQRFPTATRKTWLITEFANPGKQGEITDPFGRGLGQYRRAATEIKEAVEKISEILGAKFR